MGVDVIYVARLKTGFLQGTVSALKGETDISTAFIQMGQGLSVPLQGLGSLVGITGGVNPEHRYTMSDTLKQLGWDPESGAGRFARGALGLVLDVALDPMTYTGFGVSRHALKIGGATLNKAGSRMAVRLRNIIAKAEGITDEIAANARLQEILTPFVGGKALRSADSRMVKSAQDILEAFGKPITDTAVTNLIENGLEKYLDKGGIKWLGRTITRSATADRFGVAYDTALSKYIAQPISKAMSAMGEAAMKVKPIRGAVEAGRSIRTMLADMIGPGFISGYHMKTPSGRAQVRLHQRMLAYRMDDIDRTIERLKIVDDAGKVRSVRPDEAKLLSKAFYEADYFSNPNPAYAATFDLARAEQAYAQVPEHLKPIVDTVRPMLEHRFLLEQEHLFQMGHRTNYWHHMWKEESPYAVREALRTGKMTVEEFDAFLKSRHVHIPWEEATKAGIEQDFFRVLESRLKASASLVTTQDFLQHMADEYGMRFVKSGQKILRKKGKEGVLIADLIEDLESKGLPIDGQPFTQIGKLGEAIDLAQKGQREAALDAIRAAKPEMPEKEIEKAIGEVRAEFQRNLKSNLKLQEEMRIGEGIAPELVEEAEGIRQHLAELATLEKQLKERSSQRLLREATKRPAPIPGPAWLSGEETLAEAKDSLLTYRKGVLGGRIATLERLSTERPLTEAETELLRQAKADLGDITYALAGKPEWAKTWAGLRHLSRKALSAHEAELRALGYTAEEIAGHTRDLQAFGATILGTTQEYKKASKNFGKWATGRLPIDDPAARQLVRADLDAMEGLYRHSEELEEALAAQERAFAQTLEAVEGATEVSEGFISPEQARSLYLGQVDLEVRREGLNRLRRTLETPDEIRRYRAMLEDPQIGKRALENAAPLNASISDTGEVIRVPLHPLQARAINQILSGKGVGKYTPELFERLTGVRSLEDLSFQTAQEFLEIARRRPATLREAVRAGVMETVSTDWKRIPDFKSMRVMWEGAPVSTRDVLVPENVARAIQSATTRWKPGPAASFILGGYDRLQDLFKWSITMPWPAYWARNTTENTFKAFTEVGISAMIEPRMMEEYLLTLFGSTRPMKTALGVLPRSALIEALTERGLWRKLPTGLAEMGSPTKLAAEVIDRVEGV